MFLLVIAFIPLHGGRWTNPIIQYIQLRLADVWGADAQVGYFHTFGDKHNNININQKFCVPNSQLNLLFISGKL